MYCDNTSDEGGWNLYFNYHVRTQKDTEKMLDALPNKIWRE